MYTKKDVIRFGSIVLGIAVTLVLLIGLLRFGNIFFMYDMWQVLTGKILESTGLNPWLVRGIAAIFTIPLFWAAGMLFSRKKKNRQKGIVVLGGITALFCFSMFFVTQEKRVKAGGDFTYELVQKQGSRGVFKPVSKIKGLTRVKPTEHAIQDASSGIMLVQVILPNPQTKNFVGGKKVWMVRDNLAGKGIARLTPIGGQQDIKSVVHCEATQNAQTYVYDPVTQAMVPFGTLSAGDSVYIDGRNADGVTKSGGVQFIRRLKYAENNITFYVTNEWIPKPQQSLEIVSGEEKLGINIPQKGTVVTFPTGVWVVGETNIKKYWPAFAWGGQYELFPQDGPVRIERKLNGQWLGDTWGKGVWKNFYPGNTKVLFRIKVEGTTGKITYR